MLISKIITELYARINSLLQNNVCLFTRIKAKPVLTRLRATQFFTKSYLSHVSKMVGKHCVRQRTDKKKEIPTAKAEQKQKLGILPPPD